MVCSAGRNRAEQCERSAIEKRFNHGLHGFRTDIALMKICWARSWVKYSRPMAKARLPSATRWTGSFARRLIALPRSALSSTTSATPGFSRAQTTAEQ